MKKHSYQRFLKTKFKEYKDKRYKTEDKKGFDSFDVGYWDGMAECLSAAYTDLTDILKGRTSQERFELLLNEDEELLNEEKIYD